MNLYHKKTWISIAIIAITCVFTSCQNQTQIDISSLTKEDINKGIVETTFLSKKQAIAYANLFSSNLESEESTGLKSSINNKRIISDLNVYTENGDTLLYAINYANNSGYILIKADNSSFPIIAHSDFGRIEFKSLTDNNPLMIFISLYAQKTKAQLRSSQSVDSEYFDNWKDLGNPEYQYEISIINKAPTQDNKLRSRRRNSSNKTSIYPFIGKDLDSWCQEGNFNFAAPDKMPIGCPAIAIGMLLYDCNNRLHSKYEPTIPVMHQRDSQLNKNDEGTKDLSKRLRQIADSIPNYEWGYNGSGARPENILEGLHKLGFKKAKLINYDFETLYKNLRHEAPGYDNMPLIFNRGVLIGGYNQTGGHIWFCDGYYEQAFNVTKKFLFIKIKSWQEYDDRVYMNWGWGSSGGNGWFKADGEYWSSINQPYRNFKYMIKMFVGLGEYERPYQNQR